MEYDMQNSWEIGMPRSMCLVFEFEIFFIDQPTIPVLNVENHLKHTRSVNFAKSIFNIGCMYRYLIYKNINFLLVGFCNEYILLACKSGHPGMMFIIK